MNNSASVFTRIREMKRGREVWRVWEEPSVTIEDGAVIIVGGGLTSMGQTGALSTPTTVVLGLLLVSRYWTTESVTIIFQPRF